MSIDNTADEATKAKAASKAAKRAGKAFGRGFLATMTAIGEASLEMERQSQTPVKAKAEYLDSLNEIVEVDTFSMRWLDEAEVAEQIKRILNSRYRIVKVRITTYNAAGRELDVALVRKQRSSSIDAIFDAFFGSAA